MYTYRQDEFGATVHCDVNDYGIPLDLANTDYQYLLDILIEEGSECFNGDIPELIQADADAKLFNSRMIKYSESIDRLAMYILADGRDEVTDEVVVGTRPALDENDEAVLDSEGQPTYEDVVETIITVSAIEPLDATVEQTTYDEEGVATTSTVANPLITADVAERAAAQSIVDATPQAVIDTYNGE
jgi:hypothetical protein|tara:strand:- start:176 stop:736 length:561 start_codon:yes stop_codon:yes gene_type:complete